MRGLALIALFCVSQWASAQQKTPACTEWLRGFNLYEDETGKGEVVLKHQFVKFSDWDPMSDQFDGVVLIKALPKDIKTPVLEFQYQPKDRSAKGRVEQHRQLLPFSRAPKFRQFDTFKPKEIFEKLDDGTYTIRLKSDGRVFCEETHAYAAGD